MTLAWNTVHIGDVRELAGQLAPGSVQTIITSPPYYNLRDYGTATWEGGDAACDHAHFLGGNGASSAKQVTSGGTQKYQYKGTCGKCGAVRVDRQLGLEATPAEFVANLVAVFRALREALKPDGTCWVNLGDSFLPDKNQALIPHRFAIAMQEDGWILRSTIVWEKPNCMPDSTQDRPTNSHEYIFMFARNRRYFYDATAIAERTTGHAPGSVGNADWHKLPAETSNGRHGSTLHNLPAMRNKRSVWSIPTAQFSGVAHTSRLVPSASGDDGDGTTRITSPDCPVHGDRPAPAPTPRYDGRAGDWSSHTAHNGAGPAPTHQAAPAPTDQHRAPDSAAYTSDCSPPSCAPSATHHSNGSRRTAHAPATIPLDRPSGETTPRTGHTPASPSSAAPRPDMRESSSARDAWGAHSPPETASDTADILSRPAASAASDTSCTCQFYRIATEKTSHYATFPEALIRPCVLAGTSERGECSKCGKAWVRVVESNNPSKGANVGVDMTGGAAKTANPQTSAGLHRNAGGVYSTRRDLGWAPQCTCDAPTRPQVVLDPFMGSGTTAQVAHELGRHWLGFDLDERAIGWTRARLAKMPVGTLFDLASG